MELKQLRPKRKRSGDRKLSLPLKNQKEIVGVFNGVSVVIHNWSSMKYLYEKGCFGKGSFSKGEPKYHEKEGDIPKIIFEQQEKNHRNWCQAFEYKCPEKYFVSNSDYELSVTSVEKFLESSLNDCDKKSLDEPQGVEKNLKHELSFLEFNPDEKYHDDNFKDFVDEILSTRQSRKRITSFKSKNEVIILSPKNNPDVSSVTTIDAKLEHEFSLPEENLNLNWEESLYLKSVLGCLTVLDLNEKNMTSNELWERFKAADKGFLERYVTYHFFRSKGWIVRSGVKFGGDYLLYKSGPSHYHSNYLVNVLNEEKLSWRELIVNNRLSETFNKEVVFVKVSSQVGCEEAAFPEVLENYTVETTLLSRWFPSKERKPKT